MTQPVSCVPETIAGNTQADGGITDKRGYGQRWHFSPRHVDNLLAQGLPHLKIGKRRVRIIVSEADFWMREKFGQQRCGTAQATGKDMEAA